MADELDDTIQNPIDEQEEAQDKGEKKSVNRPSYKKLYEDLLKRFEDKEEQQESDCLFQQIHAMSYEDKRVFSGVYAQMRKECDFYAHVYARLEQYFAILENRIICEFPVGKTVNDAQELQDILKDINITLNEYKRLFNKTMIIPILNTMMSDGK